MWLIDNKKHALYLPVIPNHDGTVFLGFVPESKKSDRPADDHWDQGGDGDQDQRWEEGDDDGGYLELVLAQEEDENFVGVRGKNLRRSEENADHRQQKIAKERAEIHPCFLFLRRIQFRSTDL